MRSSLLRRVPSYPSPHSQFPLPAPKFRKTAVEWRYHHGHGARLGQYGPLRDRADYEHADGTPIAITRSRFAFQHHTDHLLVQLIRAGAAVERYEEERLLPAVPGTAEQRAWDVSIPLYLQDVDEKGKAPVPSSVLGRHLEEVFADRQTAAPTQVEDRHSGESLEPNTLFATYDPSAFVVSENDRTSSIEQKRPIWSRRRWALNDNFMVPKSPKPKNTIKGE
ncbi:hypothetical protein AGDE_04773 [Angomonas deanei]|nr:hypothetical protein AGDE_04773 [Angomonas deanei]|eukprot:EPY39156.1 hypothetical protein AGDE_04773 [Angomonas deanei]